MHEGCAVSNNLIENIRDCYRRAEHCRRKAKEQRDTSVSIDFLGGERRWLLLARVFELAARMEALARGTPAAPAVGPLKAAA